MFQGSLKGVCKKFRGCFMEVSRVFQESFKDVAMYIDGCFKVISSGFHGH